MLKAERYRRVRDIEGDITILNRTYRIKKKKLDLILKRLAPKDVKAVQYEERITSHNPMSDLEDIKTIAILTAELAELNELIKIEEQALAEVQIELDANAYQFNETEQKVFVLFYIQHLTTSEICKELHIQPNTLYKHKGAIKKQIYEKEN